MSGSWHPGATTPSSGAVRPAPRRDSQLLVRYLTTETHDDQQRRRDRHTRPRPGLRRRRPRPPRRTDCGSSRCDWAALRPDTPKLSRWSTPMRSLGSTVRPGPGCTSTLASLALCASAQVLGHGSRSRPRASRSGSRRSTSLRLPHSRKLLNVGVAASGLVAPRRARRCCMCDLPNLDWRWHLRGGAHQRQESSMRPLGADANSSSLRHPGCDLRRLSCRERSESAY